MFTIFEKVSADLHQPNIFSLLFQKPTDNSSGDKDLYDAMSDIFDDFNPIVKRTSRNRAKKSAAGSVASEGSEHSVEEEEEVEESEEGDESEVDDESTHSAPKSKKTTHSAGGRATSKKVTHVTQLMVKERRAHSVADEEEEDSQAGDEIVDEDDGSQSGDVEGDDGEDDNASVHSSATQKFPARRFKDAQVSFSLKPIPTPQAKPAKSVPDIDNDDDGASSTSGESMKSATSSKVSRKSRKYRKPTGSKSRPTTSGVKYERSAHSSSSSSGSRRAANPRRGQNVTAKKVLPQRSAAPTPLNADKGHPTGLSTAENSISTKEKPAPHARPKLTAAALAKAGKMNASEKKSRIQSWLQGIHR